MKWMRRLAIPWPTLFLSAVILGPVVAGGAVGVQAGEVSGKVVMPVICSPEVSPAVVRLEPKATAATIDSASAMPAEVALINQRGLQFVPRVQAIPLGQTLRFTNEDSETHNVHVFSPGNEFNQSMAPGQPRDFTPGQAGVIQLACDVHSHMRGFVVVSASPWVRVCSAKGRFRIESVPDGEYTLTVWHEMGAPLIKEVKVVGDTDLGSLTVSAPERVKRAPGEMVPARKWADVIDRISVLLAASLDSAGKTNGFKKARKLAEDAYWAEFEASDMETAIRLHLGYVTASDLERKFRAVVAMSRAVSEGKRTSDQAVDTARSLLLTLVKAAADLNRKGVTDGDHLQTGVATASIASPPSHGDSLAQLKALKAGLDGVRSLADRNEPDEAAAAMTSVYFDEFEPLERFIAVHKPGDVRPLELRFNEIRGEVGQGLKGERLGSRLLALHDETTSTLNRSRSIPEGLFGPAFAASLLTIVREGVEVILLLTMLLALVAKTGQASGRRAIAWGVGLAIVASAATAIALNMMVASAQGRTREILEGAVMLAAAGVLFYVSYWLISQAESKRWMSFLKRQAARGSETGHKGFLALAATAFLAVYREGAETALMYQAMIGSQAGAKAGLTGLATGLGVGLILLAGIAYLIKTTSLRLPLRPFFQVTGGLLFTMAVVFAGNGVFELQSSGILKSTPLALLGSGLPAIGVYPNVQALSVQALLLAGAMLALVVILSGENGETKQQVSAVKPGMKVGV